MKYPTVRSEVAPPADLAHHEWHVLTDGDRKRHRLRWDATHAMWGTDTAQIMTAEQAYRLAWLYVGPARG